jgi:hypothetical protein
MSIALERIRRGLDRCARRAAGVTAVLMLLSASTWAQAPVNPQSPQAPANGLMLYRGYRVDAKAILNSPNYAAIMASIPHQIDIVADCGAKPDVLRFFQSQVIVVKPGLNGGHFNSNAPGVAIDDAVAAAEKPIVLHELLHAFHFYAMSGGFRNPDLLAFYDRARNRQVYPQDAYLLKNVQEFFAVTASLYLWGNVDRPPNTREKLRAAQPMYYAWLGDFFGVKK